MRELSFIARAPSNIALIKYMGKADAQANLPENTSVSMTLDSLCTWVELTRIPGGKGEVRWVAEAPRPGLRAPEMGEKGAAKAAAHVLRVLEEAPGLLARAGVATLREPRRLDYALRSANTFPAASGIASSASAFAAITLAAAAACAEDVDAFRRALEGEPVLRRALAALSRRGSGSSCRSFEGPWVRWQDERAEAVRAAMPELAHFVILVSESPKVVSSSEAHARVKSSPLWSERLSRIERRAEELVSALGQGDFATVARIAWLEAWEMHSLFHTSAEPFTYWEPGTIDALHWLAPRVKSAQPPIVTMDAGPNVHVIVESAESSRWESELRARFGERAILSDRPGSGAVFEGVR